MNSYFKKNFEEQDRVFESMVEDLESLKKIKSGQEGKSLAHFLKVDSFLENRELIKGKYDILKEKSDNFLADLKELLQNKI